MTEATVAFDRLPDVDRDTLRDRELAEALQCGEHVLRGVAGGAGVPQAEPRDAVRVDVLGGPLEFGEDRQVVASIGGERMRHLEQHGAVTLHDEGAVSHNGPVYARVAAITPVE
jgi:hypothetical protein